MELRFIVYVDAAGLWRWRLLAADGTPIARCGQGYETREQCVGAIELLAWSARVPVLFADRVETDAETPA